MDRMLPDTLFAQDDASTLQKELDNWSHPDLESLLRFLDKSAGKPHTTACLLQFLHAQFTPEEIEKRRRMRQKKHLGLLDWEDEDFCGEFRWEITGGSARILEYLGHDETVRIPEMLGGCPVRWIARTFFLGDGTIRCLLIPEGIEVGHILPHEAAALWGKTAAQPEIVFLPREFPLPPGGEEARTMVIAKEYAIFGCYGGNSDGEPKPLRWKVLRRENGRMLLLSCGILEMLPYHRSRSAVLWPECDLRTWLNECFFRAAFTAQEQSLILETDLTGQANPMFRTRDSSVSKDRIFLLQPQEASSCPAKDSIWTRMPGLNTQYSVRMLPSGEADYQGCLVNRPAGVRPALWVRV